MDPETFVSPEAGIVALVTATICSPRLRGWIRKGAIYATAGVLVAGDEAKKVAQGFAAGKGHTPREHTEEQVAPEPQEAAV
jgi:hypothetical protein